MEYNPQVSVDCVVFGFDGERLKVLLVERDTDTAGDDGTVYNNRKLPGSIIRQDEDLDSAAYRILEEYTGLTNIYLHQFQAFGKPQRSSAADEPWLEKIHRLKISRLITVAFIALIPTLIQMFFNFPASVAMLFGGTSLIILVGVDLETMRQLDAMMKMHHHDGFVDAKKRRLKKF